MPSGSDWAAIITALALLVTAVGTVVNLFLNYWTRREVKAQAENIQKIETATNSMKDALVKASGEAGHAAGLAEGNLAGDARLVAAALARKVIP